MAAIEREPADERQPAAADAVASIRGGERIERREREVAAVHLERSARRREPARDLEASLLDRLRRERDALHGRWRPGDAARVAVHGEEESLVEGRHGPVD